ncbi:MAG: 4-deoxy-4-formamido-L-arabinose-phosphoundecaprenol deformylase [Betaproteobacteria bacterium]|nr:4-deoxy-4-formamido-L-arabinose-phosphoundecaprenol deformylase [Betaproteobacteria bacterium]
MKLALKIDVDTYRGTREGVPRLVELLKKHGVGATFLFSLGPDHTGRAIRRAFRPGFAKKVSRTSVLEHYGLKTLLYGTLLPGPDIGATCADILRQVRDEGFEVGIHCWDHVRWQDGLAGADEAWTRAEMELALARFKKVFSETAKVHGAAGWQMNIHAMRLTERLGFHYASDTRGVCPFVPVWNAEPFAIPQLPTTLPTLDELIGVAGITRENVAQRLLELTANPPPSGHVYTLHAELEGGKFLPIFETLVEGWIASGLQLTSLAEMAGELSLNLLPRHEVVIGQIPGRSGTLAIQGAAFLDVV